MTRTRKEQLERMRKTEGRMRWLRNAALLLALPLAVGLVLATGVLAREPGGAEAKAASPVVTVYKSPTCGCCGGWVEHMRAEGYTPGVRTVDDVQPIKDQHGVPARMGSCHTAVVDGYAIEGHVPADAVAKLLRERAEVAGIAVPGMPAGAPGMGHGGGYDVLAFTRGGTTTVFMKK